LIETHSRFSAGFSAARGGEPAAEPVQCTEQHPLQPDWDARHEEVGCGDERLPARGHRRRLRQSHRRVADPRSRDRDCHGVSVSKVPIGAELIVDDSTRELILHSKTGKTQRIATSSRPCAVVATRRSGRA
jgi:hypothetical protein